MSDPRIYLDYKHQEATIEEAIAWLTDDRIDAGDWCDQTLCDMRDAMLVMYQRLAAAEDAAREALECFDIVTQNDVLANMTVQSLRVGLLNRYPWLDVEGDCNANG